MTVDLDRFRSAIHRRGISMGNRYTVSISNTANMRNVGTFSEEEMALCTNVNLPSISFNTFMLRQHMNPTVRIPHDVIFEGLSLDFMCFDDGQPYMKFFNWQRAMYGEGMRMQDFAHYAQGKIVTVRELNRQNQAIEEFQYINCYPTGVTKSLSSENRSSPEKFTVSLSYEFIKSRSLH